MQRRADCDGFSGVQDMRGLSVHGYGCGCTAAFAYLQVVVRMKGRGHVQLHDVGRTRTRRVIEEEAGNTSGLKDRLRGQIGVRTRALSDGWTIGPPAEREYAVEPVGVETIKPSD